MDYIKGFPFMEILGIADGFHESEGIVPLFNCIIGNKIAVDNATCFKSHNAMASVLLLMFAFTLYSFVWSIVGKNCSKVDQIWSITPWVYCWVIYYHHQSGTSGGEGGGPSRLLVLSSLVTLWGLRLTFNFWRRGGYGNLITHEEDYRWEHVRKTLVPNKYLFVVFNFLFIAFYQNFLLMLIAVPAYWVGKSGNDFDMKNPLDLGLVMIFIGLLITETITDEQQWRFQNFKHNIPADKRAANESREVRQGFLSSGLFKHSRHPNYFAEQVIWVVVYLFSVNFGSWNSANWSNFVATQSYRSIGGAILLIHLFYNSIEFSEGITATKYPEYARYQTTTRKCIPSIVSMLTSTNNILFGMKESTTMSLIVFSSIAAFLHWLEYF